MSSRSRAREIVLQLLYQDDLNSDADASRRESFLRARLHDNPKFVDWASKLLDGVLRNKGELDQMLSDIAVNWRLERMAVTDRNILRIGAYEILYTDTPDRVVINEAVELAKRFGARQSPPFVNGVLDRLLHTVKDDG